MVNDDSNQSVGYRVGQLHPTAKDKYEQARRGEPSIPHAGRYTGFKAMVRGGDGGRQGVRDGATHEGGGQGSTDTGGL